MKKLLLIMLTAVLYASCVKQTDPPTANAEDMTMDDAVAADTPIVKISNPKNGDTVAGTVTIKVKVTDNVSIDSVTCTVDGVSLGKQTTTPYNFVWDTKNCVEWNAFIDSNSILTILEDQKARKSPLVQITPPFSPWSRN
jgi:hypothetical protein